MTKLTITIQAGDAYINPTTKQQIEHNEDIAKALIHLQEDIILLTEKYYTLCCYEHIVNKSILIAENSTSIHEHPHQIIPTT